MILVDLLEVAETVCIKLVDKSLDNQLGSSLLTTCCRLVIIKLELGWRKPGSGFMISAVQTPGFSPPALAPAKKTPAPGKKNSGSGRKHVKIEI